MDTSDDRLLKSAVTKDKLIRNMIHKIDFLEACHRGSGPLWRVVQDLKVHG